MSLRDREQKNSSVSKREKTIIDRTIGMDRRDRTKKFKKKKEDRNKVQKFGGNARGDVWCLFFYLITKGASTHRLNSLFRTHTHTHTHFAYNA